MASSTGIEWNPARFTLATLGPPNKAHPDGPHPYSLVILNQPIKDLDHFKALSDSALWTVCADGGLNRVFELPLKQEEKLHHYKGPDAVCGDMDSVRPEICELFRSSTETKFVEDHDQNSTDFMKSLRYINRIATTGGWLEEDWLRMKHYDEGESERAFLFEIRDMRMPPLDVVVLGGLGGRADQAFSQLHHLYAASQDPSLSKLGHLYLVTPESIICLLEKGLNRICTPVGLGQFTENVGIIPIARPSIITTRGLEWDVTDWPTEFGGQISTSNHIKRDIVEVETTERVLFTVELAPLDTVDGCLRKTSTWTWVN